MAGVVVAVDLSPISGLELTPSAVLWAVGAVLITVLVARYAARAVLRLGERMPGISHDLTLQAARVVRYFVIAIGAGIVLALLGAPLQPILAALLVVAAAGLLMARGIADNLGAGLVLQARRPIRLGDVIGSCGYEGRVADLNSRTVVIETTDGRTVHLPNRKVMDNPLVNASRTGRCRSGVQVRVRAEPHEGVDAVGQLLVDAATRSRGVLETPRPHLLLTAADPGRVVLLLRFWHEPGLDMVVSSRVASSVHAALTEHGRACAVAWPAPPLPLLAPGEL